MAKMRMILSEAILTSLKELAPQDDNEGGGWDDKNRNGRDDTLP